MSVSPTEPLTSPDRLGYEPEELLDSGEYDEPLFAGGVRCHGGFDEQGRYRSPRAVKRTPAIGAWQARLARDESPLLQIDPALLPPQYPGVEQAKLLLSEGVTEPIVRSLACSLAPQPGRRPRAIGL